MYFETSLLGDVGSSTSTSSQSKSYKNKVSNSLIGLVKNSAGCLSNQVAPIISEDTKDILLQHLEKSLSKSSLKRGLVLNKAGMLIL